MAKLFAKKTTSDTILVGAFPSAKLAGEVCVFGSLIGFATLNTEEGVQGTVNVGKQIAVFQVAKSAISNPEIGTDVYVTPAGALTTTATDNKLLGTVVVVGGDTFDLAITG